MRLSPFKYTCLRALAQGPLIWTEEGWRSTVAVRGLWNSHTVLWLAWRGYCVAEREKSATVTAAGRGVAQMMESM